MSNVSVGLGLLLPSGPTFALSELINQELVPLVPRVNCTSACAMLLADTTSKARKYFTGTTFLDKLGD